MFTPSHWIPLFPQPFLGWMHEVFDPRHHVLTSRHQILWNFPLTWKDIFCRGFNFSLNRFDPTCHHHVVTFCQSFSHFLCNLLDDLNYSSYFYTLINSIVNGNMGKRTISKVFWTKKFGNWFDWLNLLNYSRTDHHTDTFLSQAFFNICRPKKLKLKHKIQAKNSRKKLNLREALSSL